MSNGQRWRTAVTYLVLTAAGATTAAPIVWMVSTSLKTPGAVMEAPPRWTPRRRVMATVEGQRKPVFTLAGQPGSQVVLLAQTPRRARVHVIAPPTRAGKTLTVAPERLIPVSEVHFEWSNYRQAWQGGTRIARAFGGLLWEAPSFLVWYSNSLFVSLAITFGTLLTSSLAAYAFARLRFPARDWLFLGYLATLMVPAIVVIVPLYALVRRMGLYNTYWALILPGMFSAYYTFMLRQFFLSIPRDLEEAALLDGAGRLSIYWRIILPLSKPALAALAIFAFLHSWNDFLWPLIVIDDDALKTLPVGLATFEGQYGTEWALLMAASVIVMIPVLIVFVVGQRYFIRGILLSGLKA